MYFIVPSWWEPAAQPCVLDRSSYRRRAAEKIRAPNMARMFIDFRCDRACTLVINDNDAIRADYAFRQLEGRRDGAIRKQSLSSTQRDRIHHQAEHIDQIMLDKSLKEITASPNV
jgi:hypothetical protein